MSSRFGYPIPADLLPFLLRLDVETGRLFWLQRGPEWFDEGKYSAARQCAVWNSRYANMEAMTADSGTGYKMGAIFNRGYRTHRVIFALFHGHWPPEEVDHKDGDKLNNRPSNLRAASRRQNQQNSRSYRGSTSRFSGVSWHPDTKKWAANCSDPDGNYRYLGIFADEQEAARAYDAAAEKWHGEFASLNFPRAALARIDAGKP